MILVIKHNQQGVAGNVEWSQAHDDKPGQGKMYKKKMSNLILAIPQGHLRPGCSCALPVSTTSCAAGDTLPVNMVSCIISYRHTSSCLSQKTAAALQWSTTASFRNLASIAPNSSHELVEQEGGKWYQRC
jgi:hypothetical protein